MNVKSLISCLCTYGWTNGASSVLHPQPAVVTIAVPTAQSRNMPVVPTYYSNRTSGVGCVGETSHLSLPQFTRTVTGFKAAGTA